MVGLTFRATLVFYLLWVAAASAETGLDFQGHLSPDCQGEPTVRFKLTDPHLNGLPIYGDDGAGVTYIWRAFPRQQTGFYTAFFWANDDGTGQASSLEWHDGLGDTYYGAHPFPQNHSGFDDTHFWEISADNGDFGDPTFDGVNYDQWYTQVLRVWGANGQPKNHEFYWNWPDQTKKVTYVSESGYANLDPPFPALTFGDAPWNPGCEIFNGILRGFQIYSTLLSLEDITGEVATPLSTSAGLAGIWYLNLNPTPSDISDQSSQGHHPTWVGDARPALWESSLLSVIE
jgi:hypothetical protein